MIKNPVMFVVEVGAVLTTIQLIWNASHHFGHFGFGLQITLWLWFTVLFANFAEAMAEGRGKAQADTLRKARAETQAHLLRSDGSTEIVASSKLRAGDVDSHGAISSQRRRSDRRRGFGRRVRHHRRIRAVIRESGGDRSAVTGGTRFCRTKSVRITQSRRLPRSND
jgi:K+-transporting ATPase ATPase B chain